MTFIYGRLRGVFWWSAHHFQKVSLAFLAAIVVCFVLPFVLDIFWPFVMAFYLVLVWLIIFLGAHPYYIYLKTKGSEKKNGKQK